jgi:cytochrome b561
MTRDHYDPITQTLHWLVAIAIVGTYALGLLMEDLRGPAKALMLGNHMSLGVVVLGLTAVRLGWHAVAPKVDPLPASQPLVTWAARIGHLALYAAMVAVPLIGLATIFAKGRDVSLFGLFTLPSPMAANRALGKPLEEVHEIAAHLLVLLAGLHAAVAIVHQFWLRDGTLGRMVPFLPASRR